MDVNVQSRSKIIGTNTFTVTITGSVNHWQRQSLQRRVHVLWRTDKASGLAESMNGCRPWTSEIPLFRNREALECHNPPHRHMFIARRGVYYMLRSMSLH